ncbi:MAG: hypothetical protein H6506_04825 [Calditrichaeota bacterium]|nr:hypothetical protein [Calditrichota bacterium]MCB9391959.1 hypothetical protein [Calditrichota bacterium]
MKRFLISLLRPSSLLAGLMLVTAMLVGCSAITSPTASDGSEPVSTLWTPEPGDEVVPGRPIPMIQDDSYWETPGNQVNPWRNPFAATPVLINGLVGGTVTCLYHSYDVPAGAVQGIISFTMVLASRNAVAVDCGPSPLDFADGAPVRLHLSYANTQYDPDWCATRGIEPLDASELDVWYMAPDGSLERQDVGRHFDPGSKTISVNVDHFSRYILA